MSHHLAFALVRQLAHRVTGSEENSDLRQKLGALIDKVERVTGTPGLRDRSLPAIESLLGSCFIIEQPATLHGQTDFIRQLLAFGHVEARDSQGRVIAEVSIAQIRLKADDRAIDILTRTSETLLESICDSIIKSYRFLPRP